MWGGDTRQVWRYAHLSPVLFTDSNLYMVGDVGTPLTSAMAVAALAPLPRLSALLHMIPICPLLSGIVLGSSCLNRTVCHFAQTLVEKERNFVLVGMDATQVWAASRPLDLRYLILAHPGPA